VVNFAANKDDIRLVCLALSEIDVYRGKQVKINYVTQTGTPPPTFLIF